MNSESQFPLGLNARGGEGTGEEIKEALGLLSLSNSRSADMNMYEEVCKGGDL